MHLTPQESDELTLHQAAYVAHKRLAGGGTGSRLRIVVGLQAYDATIRPVQ